MPISNMIYVAHATVGRLDLWCPAWLKLYTYQPPRRRFPGACLRLGSGTYLLFSSGRVVINGVKAEPDVGEMEDLLGIRLSGLTLSHLSGYMKVGTLDPYGLCDMFEHAVYEPELHPGVMFKINSVSVIAYHTGTLFYCGCKSIAHQEEVESIIIHQIQRCLLL